MNRFLRNILSKNREEVKTDKFVLTNLHFSQNAVLYIAVNNKEIGELRLIHFSVAK